MAEDTTRDVAAFLRERVVPSGGSRHGVVIGIEEYRDSRLNLRCARADAQAIYDLMVDSECGMFPEDNVWLLLDGEATRESVWRTLSSLRRQAGEDDTVWIYYAGHAAPEESNLYWVTHDADVDDLYGTGLSDVQLSRVLNDIRARRLLVLLDCCHAAATALQKNPTRAVLTAEEVFAGYKGEGRITISSSDGKEKSVELSDVGHGAFTYFLERGLRGEADQDGGGVVTAGELWNYLRGKVTDASRRAGNAQTPVLIGEMTHDVPLSLNTTSVARKERIADAVTAVVGLGDDHLTTEDAQFCLHLLSHGPATREQEELLVELEGMTCGAVPKRMLRKLVAHCRHQSESAPPKPRPAPQRSGEERGSAGGLGASAAMRADRPKGASRVLPYEKWLAKEHPFGAEIGLWLGAYMLGLLALVLPIFIVFGIHMFLRSWWRNEYFLYAAETSLRNGDPQAAASFAFRMGGLGVNQGHARALKQSIAAQLERTGDPITAEALIGTRSSW